ncbi:MAG: hypothetical protein AB1671_22990 [Thermodesulfobacteriota bacterium]
MERVIAVRGKLADSRHIELDEPITEIEGPVEVFVRPIASEHEAKGESIFDLIARLPGGNRSKEDIDRQIREERESWGDR